MDGVEVVRLAAGDDMAAVARVYARSWRHAYRGIVPQSYLDSVSYTHLTLPTNSRV